jgi:hypothetical protein
MDKKTITTAIANQIGQKRGRKLNRDELQFLMQRIKQTDTSIFNGKNIADLIPVLVKVYESEIQKIKKIHVEGPIDMQEILAQEMEQSSINNNKALLKKATWDTLLQSPELLQSILNPSSLQRTSYLILDRKFQAKDANNITEFRWNVTDTSREYDNKASVVSTVEIQNIFGIKMYPFVFPNTPNATTGIKRLSVEIVELNMQAYISAAHKKKFHFMFETQKISNDVYSADNAVDSTLNDSEFRFHDTIMELNSITLRFGNPFKTLSLDPDILTGTIAIVGAQTTVSFGVPHRLALGDIIVIDGFATDNPIADVIEIDQINNPDGWPTTALTSTTATIDIDLSGLTGNIINVPHNIYLESKRFVIQLEIKHTKSL